LADIRDVIDIEEVLREAGVPVKSRSKIITEATVAQPKKFRVASESVSQNTKDEHAELYEMYVNTYNKLSIELDSEKSTGIRKRELKIDETYNRNGIYLHELYFANSFDVKSQIFADMLCCVRFERDWGNFDAWQRDFFSCAMSAREGWACTGYGLWEKKYVNFFIDGHDAHVPLGIIPVLVIDMWTHASKDYGNNKKEYLTSQLKEINWDVVEERVQKCEKFEIALCHTL